MPTTVPQLLSLAAVAVRLGYDPEQPDTLYRLIHDRDPRRRLPAVKIGGQWRVSEPELAAWLARQPRNTPPADPSPPPAVARRTRRPASRQGSARRTTGVAQ